jgi:O-antigen/teichoic acid export membrane protein
MTPVLPPRALPPRLAGAASGGLLRVSAALALRLAGSALGFAAALLLGNLLGTAGYGVYAFTLAWVGLLGVAAQGGFPLLLLRQLPLYRDQERWGSVRGILRLSRLRVGTASLAILLLAGAIVLGSSPENAVLRGTFGLGLCLLPVVSLIQVDQAALQGLNRVLTGQLPDLLLRPLLFIVLLSGCAVISRPNLEPRLVMGLQLLSALSALALLRAALGRELPRQAPEAPLGSERAAFRKASLRLFLINLVMALQTQFDLICLGSLRGSEEVGQYAAASRLAALLSFVLLAVNAVASPVFSSLHGQGKRAELQRYVTVNCRWASLVAGAAALLILLYTREFLTFFGSGFDRAAGALTILATAQLVNVGAGSVGTLLMMTGHERDTFSGLAKSAALNVVLSAALIPRYGIEGAAVASGASTILWNLILVRLVWKRLRINPTVICRLG